MSQSKALSWENTPCDQKQQVGHYNYGSVNRMDNRSLGQKSSWGPDHQEPPLTGPCKDFSFRTDEIQRHEVLGKERVYAEK